MSLSPGAAAFASTGWSRTAMAIGQQSCAPFGQLEDPPYTGKVAVTGRKLQSLCQLTVLGDPAPHPALKTAVDRALAKHDLEARATALRDVFARFGQVYVVSVELGGVKYATMMVQNRGQVRES